MGKVIISLSAGTVLLVMFLGFSLCAAVVTAGYCAKRSPELYTPHEGIKGALERLKNDIDYGPVNMQAAKEVKNGLPLFDRMRANRQARQANQCTQHACRQAYSYTVTTQTANEQPQGVEYPGTPPTAAPIDCPDGKCPLRKAEAIKTGAFICSNCRQPKIADWHTDWKEDGTPETFLCKKCHSFMTPEQRKTALISYQARQVQSAGVAGLLHPESAK